MYETYLLTRLTCVHVCECTTVISGLVYVRVCVLYNSNSLVEIAE